MAEYRTAPDHSETGWPKGVPYIIGNEGCERFSFYGMKAILFVYLTHMLSLSGSSAQLAESQATDVVHTFVAGVYALPMIGALLAERLWGKYKTILWLSLVYCAGHACLALFESNYQGFMIGLMLIAIGSGGIKPCVSANVGDQFGRGNWNKVERVYQAFYFIINFGSLFATMMIPWLKANYGFSVAFGVPGILMFIATVCFWAGRNVFVHVPPKPGGKYGLIDTMAGILLFMTIAVPMFGAGFSHTYAELAWASKIIISLGFFAAGMAVFAYRQTLEPDDGFLAVMFYAVRAKLTGHELAPLPAADADHAGAVGADRAGNLRSHAFWGPAARRFGQEAAEGAPAVLKIITVFAMVSVFWALFDQHASSWVAQAKEMDRTFNIFGFSFELMPEQISSANPLLVMGLVPLMGLVGYPALSKIFRTEMTPLKRMTLGMFIAAASFALVAMLQARIDSGELVHIGWQLLAYLIITVAEVMVSVTGLEFAYTQAPRRMKSLIMGLWLLSVSFGNILVALLARFENLPRVQFFWTFSGLMVVAAVLFGIRAAFYQYKTYTQ
jgi:POT family proton-dependent oligopeptide transporter